MSKCNNAHIFVLLTYLVTKTKLLHKIFNFNCVWKINLWTK